MDLNSESMSLLDFLRTAGVQAVPFILNYTKDSFSNKFLLKENFIEE